MFVHYIHFILTSGHEKILTSEKCLFGHLGTSKGKGRQYLFRQALLVRKTRKQKNNQSTPGRIVAVSLIFGPLGPWDFKHMSYVLFPAKFWKL